MRTREMYRRARAIARALTQLAYSAVFPADARCGRRLADDGAGNRSVRAPAPARRGAVALKHRAASSH